MTAGCCAVVGMDARLMKGGVRMKGKFEQIADVNRLKSCSGNECRDKRAACKMKSQQCYFAQAVSKKPNVHYCFLS